MYTNWYADNFDWFYHWPDGRFIPPRHMVIKNKIRRKRMRRK